MYIPSFGGKYRKEGQIFILMALPETQKQFSTEGKKKGFPI
jgi:hypothetical protein